MAQHGDLQPQLRSSSTTTALLITPGSGERPTWARCSASTTPRQSRCAGGIPDGRQVISGKPIWWIGPVARVSGWEGLVVTSGGRKVIDGRALSEASES